VFPGRSYLPGTPNFTAALLFVYPDGAQVALFEMGSPGMDELQPKHRSVFSRKIN
jgi:hypothetical protein